MSQPAFEGAGVFYLGTRYDADANAPTSDLVLYDNADLTTHAVIIGMTGSGKTGLGLSLLEEAALDQIPILAIDPKGDLGNLLLTFPDLAPGDFAPWIDPQVARQNGQSVEDAAAATAQRWREGLAASGQDAERLRRLRAAADFALYTPGSTAGRSLSVLRSFDPPPADTDGEALRERIAATVSGVLSLAGVEADPLQSGEHIFLTKVLADAWAAGRSLALADLIAALANPPFSQIGVMDVEAFFPAKQRQALAMRLNGLLASPSFAAWQQGDPLDVDGLLYTASGQPRVAVFSIAHLNDQERMFFVTRLLGEVVAWMRRQSGTGSLRAILYMDELFGYLPPQGSPPSKDLFLLLLKQARAFGLGLVLATQNPVDLDYKALANCGTWFVGRLQTERDKARLLEGLEGAAPGGFDRAEMDRLLSNLPKRTFLLHNVHERGPVLLQTRWVMSYLAGPLTREQIKRLTPATAAVAPAAPAAAAPPPAATAPAGGPPALDRAVRQVYLAPAQPADGLVYVPMLLARADVPYRQASLSVDATQAVHLLAEVTADVRWEQAEALPAAPATTPGPLAGATFQDVPAPLRSPSAYGGFEKALKPWLQQARPLTLFQSKTLKATSAPGEDERAFRIRLAQLAREQRDAKKEDLRQRYAKRLETLEGQIRRAEEAQAREQAQASQKKMDTVVNVGMSLLGAFLGGRRGASSAIGKVQSAARSVSRASKEHGDVARAGQKVDDLQAQYAELDAQLTKELEALDLGFVPETEPLETATVTAKQTDIQVAELALAWVPYTTADGRMRRA